MFPTNGCTTCIKQEKPQSYQVVKKNESGKSNSNWFVPFTTTFHDLGKLNILKYWRTQLLSHLNAESSRFTWWCFKRVSAEKFHSALAVIIASASYLCCKHGGVLYIISVNCHLCYIWVGRPQQRHTAPNWLRSESKSCSSSLNGCLYFSLKNLYFGQCNLMHCNPMQWPSYTQPVG